MKQIGTAQNLNLRRSSRYLKLHDQLSKITINKNNMIHEKLNHILYRINDNYKFSDDIQNEFDCRLFDEILTRGENLS